MNELDKTESPLSKKVGQPESGSPIADARAFSDLKSKSVRGGMVTLVSQGVSAVIQLASTVILAHLLSPKDFGIIAMVMVVTAFAGLFQDLGLSAAVIQTKELSHAQKSNLFWLNVLVGLVLTLLVAAASPLVAVFYHREELVEVTRALSLTFFLGSLGSQHSAMLEREMQFTRRASATVAGVILTFLVSLALAVSGYSYWALVWGSLSGTICTSLCFVLLSPLRPGLPSRGSGVKSMLQFGAHVTSFNFVNYLSRNLDNILIGRTWGADALGFYSRAYQLLMFPINNLRSPLSAVAFPAMSKLEANSQEYRSYYRGLIRILAMVTMPIVAWMYAASNEVVLITLGEKWLASAQIFSVLAISGFIQPVSSMRGLILLSSGQAKRNFYAGMITAAVVSFAFVVGNFWGPLGLAWAYAAAVWLLLYPMHLFCIRGTSIRSGDLLAVIAVPALASIAGLIILHALNGVFSGLQPARSILVKGALILSLCGGAYTVHSKSRRIILGTWEKLGRNFPN